MYLIAEIGQAHDGSLGIAHSFIDALKGTGIDAIKFQMHIADAESSIDEPFRVKFSYADKNRIDYWRRMEFNLEQWNGIKNHCEEYGFDFIVSAFSNLAIDNLEKLNVTKYKIGSGEVSNLLILEKISRTKKPVILSSGLSSLEELDRSVSYLTGRVKSIALTQCTTAYPTSPNTWGLNAIKILKDRFNLPVGFSDHSGDIYACLFAGALGAELLEFHVTFDKSMFGPDSKASLTIKQVKQLVKGIEQLKIAKSNPATKSLNEEMINLKNIFEKSLSVNKVMKKGMTLNFEDLEGKKPYGKGISAKEFNNVIGRKLLVNKNKWDYLNWYDVNV
ncbi:N-acetylneuraminate synthase family protein [Verrucomicrobia bacterium]|nr:N-acetylneuraminate synthase family protein [Verrucomicrobiota bacterium]